MRVIATLIAMVYLFVAPVLGQNVEPLQSINSKLASIIDNNASAPEVQVATLPATLEWSDNGGKYQFYQLCDVLPKWGPTVAPSGISLSRRYNQYLMGIKAPQGDPVADQQQRAVAAEASKTWQKYVAARKKIIDGWLKLAQQEQALPEENRTAYSTYVQGAGIDLAALEISYNSALTRWQPLAARAAPSSVGRALNNLISTASQVKVKTFGGADTNVLSCDPQVDLSQAITNAKAKYAAANPSAPDIVLAFSRQTGQKTQNWNSWGGSAGWGPFSVSASGTHYDVHINDNNFALKLEMPTVIRFAITRPWLDLNVVQTYTDTSVLPGSELANLRPLFGANGSFSLVPIEFIVAYKPRVSVTMGSSDYQNVKNTFNAGGSFSIGPFSVGGSGGSGSEVEKWDDQASTVVVGTSADTFVLIGVRNRILP